MPTPPVDPASARLLNESRGAVKERAAMHFVRTTIAIRSRHIVRAAFFVALGLIVRADGALAQFAPNFTVGSPTAILVDYESGSVLYQKNADRPWHPASLAKLMTMEIVFNEIKSGELKLDEELVVSANAWRRGGAPAGGSTMFAAVYSRISVENLLQGAIVQSGNDACIVFAEAIAGNEDAFARLMNARARELGLDSANFRNSTGLHDPEQAISVRDLAKLATHLIRTYPEFYKYFGQTEFTWNKIRQANRNPLLEMDIGADGMKTGNTKEAGFGLVGTAKQGEQRLIVVVHGAENAKDRANDAKRLLEWGFRSFESKRLFRDGEVIAQARTFGGDERYVPLVADGPVYLLSPRAGGDKFLARVHYRGPLRAPLAKGTEVARLKVYRGQEVALELPLFAAADISEGTLIQRAYDSTTEIAGGWVRKGINTVLKR
jgi:D-alanyl-D-alanine carboxypeptidase (penicillin-binding protein 5/6)